MVESRERQRELLSASREREKKMQIKLQEMSEQRQSSLDKKRKKFLNLTETGLPLLHL